MKLFKAELYKVWSSVYFRVILLILIVGNLFLIWTQTNVQVDSEEKQAWKQVGKQLSDMSMEERGIFIGQAFDRIDALYTIDTILGMEDSVDPAYFSELKKNHQNAFDMYLDEYTRGDYLTYMDSAVKEYIFFAALKEEYTLEASYQAYLEGIHRKAEVLTDVSIFQSEDGVSFDERCIRQADEKYSALGDVVIDYVPQKGLMTALNFKITDMFLIVYMFLISAALIQSERDNGMLRLIYTTPLGRKKTACAKFFVMAVSMAVMVVILYSSNLLYCEMTYGLGNLRRSIQSVPDLRQCPLNINVLEYILLFIVLKWVAVWIIGCLILFLSVKITKVPLCVLTGMLLLGIQECILLLIPASGHMSWLRYIRMLSLLETNEYMGNYTQLNIFGYPVFRIHWQMITGIVWLCILGIIYYFAADKISFESRSGIRLSVGLFRKKRPVMLQYLTGFEVYKLLWMQRCGIILVVFFAFAIYQGVNVKGAMNAEEVVYRKYAKMFEGQLTKEKVRLLQDENEKFEPIYQLQDMYSLGKVDEAQFSVMMESYTSLNFHKNIFDSFCERQLDYLKEHPEAEIVYSKGYEWLFDLDENKDGKMMMITMFVMCMIFGGLFSVEQNTGMINMIRVTPKGRKSFIREKFRICFWISMTAAVISLIPSWLVAVRDYGLPCMWAPAQSIEIFENISSGVPLAGILIVQVLMRWQACFTVSVITCYISCRENRILFCIVFCAVLFCLCPAIALNGMEQLWWFSFYPLFHGSLWIGKETYAWILLLYVLSSVGLSVTFTTAIGIRYGFDYDI